MIIARLNLHLSPKAYADVQYKIINTKIDPLSKVICLIPNLPTYYIWIDLSVRVHLFHPAHLEGQEDTKQRNRENEKTEIVEPTLKGTRPCKNIIYIKFIQKSFFIK